MVNWGDTFCCHQYEMGLFLWWSRRILGRSTGEIGRCGFALYHGVYRVYRIPPKMIFLIWTNVMINYDTHLINHGILFVLAGGRPVFGIRLINISPLNLGLFHRNILSSEASKIKWQCVFVCFLLLILGLVDWFCPPLSDAVQHMFFIS